MTAAVTTGRLDWGYAHEVLREFLRGCVPVPSRIRRDLINRGVDAVLFEVAGQSVGRYPGPIRCAVGRLESGVFEPTYSTSSLGAEVLCVFPVWRMPRPCVGNFAVDLVAFSANQPGRFGTLLGTGDVLGDHLIGGGGNASDGHGPLLIYGDPVEYLAAPCGPGVLLLARRRQQRVLQLLGQRKIAATTERLLARIAADFAAIRTPELLLATKS